MSARAESRPLRARRPVLVDAIALGLAALAFGGPARAQDANPDPPAADASTARSTARFAYGFAVGYGAGIAPRSKQKGRDVADVQTLAIQPVLSVRLVEAGDGSAWYHGRLDGTLTALMLLNFDPRLGIAGGPLAGLRYGMRPGERIQPWIDGALGVGGIDFDLQSQADGLAFFIQAGFGARWRLDEGHAVSGGFRWRHVSNAQTKSPNAGIGTLGFQLGLDF